MDGTRKKMDEGGEGASGHLAAGGHFLGLTALRSHFQAALSHSQETGAASVTQASRSREVSMH